MAGLKFSNNLTQGQASKAGFEIDFSPSVAILAGRYDTLGINVSKFSTPLKKAVNQVMIPSIATNFHKHGRPRWPALADETIAQRGGDAQMLNRTGNLLSVATSAGIWTITDKSATVRSLPGAEYGGIHQGGASFTSKSGGGVSAGVMSGGSWVKVGRTKKWVASEGAVKKFAGKQGAGGTIPARPFLMIQEKDQADIGVVFEKWLAQITNLAVNWR